MSMEQKKNYTFDDLVQITKQLRSENGCPWDRKQTHESLRTCMKEEAYEVIEAIERHDMDNLKEELGDVLLQVTMHSEIASEQKEFTLDEVIDGICEKLIRRHPHVFGEQTVTKEEQLLDNWEEIKKKEKGEMTPLDGILRVPLALPACMRAQKVQKKAEKAGYLQGGCKEVMTKEQVGERLFHLLNEARILGIDGEEALTEYIKKFVEGLSK